MTIVVFTGPTLAPAEGGRILEAVYRPPAAKGDVYRETLNRPAAIAIIDGYFHRVASVWHKEILWAMGQGIPVFGAASMGALRAAELAAFGMRGHGEIFEAYRDGRLEDDDEVAVIHGPPELGFRPLSEAMANIRASLAAAESQNVISPRMRSALERIGKSLFYADRSYERLLHLAGEQALSGTELRSLDLWLRDNAIDQKAADAKGLLRLLLRWSESETEPLRVSYEFESTDMWHALLSDLRRRETAEEPPMDGQASTASE